MILKQTGIEVNFDGMCGDMQAIIAKVSKVLREHGESKEYIDFFKQEATSSGYLHFLCTVMDVVKISNISQLL